MRLIKTIVLLSLCFLVESTVWAFDEYEDFPQPQPEHKQELSYYVESYCKEKGRAFARIQNNHVVDCMTAETLWKVDYADNWPQALAQALALPIYDDYRGDDKFAPISGVVLVQEDSDDFKKMVELRQLVQHYKLPVHLDTLENYAKSSVEEPKKTKFFKNFQFDFK